MTVQLRLSFERKSLRTIREKRLAVLDARTERLNAEVDRLQRELLVAKQQRRETEREVLELRPAGRAKW